MTSSDDLYEEARDLAEWEDDYRKLPPYKQDARIQQIMKDLTENENYLKNVQEKRIENIYENTP